MFDFFTTASPGSPRNKDRCHWRGREKAGPNCAEGSAEELPEHDGLVDTLPIKTGEDFHALEVDLQEKNKQQRLVCMKRTVLFRYYRTTNGQFRDNY